MANELVIPPDIRPESPARIERIDDQTFKFRPMMGRNWRQANSFGDPRWSLKYQYRGLRLSDAARMHAVMAAAQGGYRTVMLSPYQANRGSFATTYSSELLTSSDFSATTGWAAGSDASIAVSNNTLRVKRIANGSGGNAYAGQTLSGLTTYAPIFWRFFVSSMRGANAVTATFGGTALDASGLYGTPGTTGHHGRVIYSVDGTATLYIDNQGNSVSMAGDYYDVLYSSAARCALVDGGGNAGVRSDEFDNASWTKNGCTITANAYTAADGSATMDALVENSATSGHYVEQSVTVTSAIQDICASFVVAGAGRNWCWVEISEGGATSVIQYFNLSAGGSLGSAGTGGGWSNRRAFVSNLGNSRVQCVLVARKTTSATAIVFRVGAASADAVSSYLGVGTAAIGVWRGMVKSDSFPTRGSQTTTAAVTSESQSGSGVYVKGLPASQTGLLLAGDWFELDGQLKQCTADLDSDAAGLGYLQFRPKIYRAVADNMPVIVTKPLGRFELANSAGFDAKFGLYADYDLEFEEVYE